MPPKNMILAIPVDGSPPVDVWEGTPCIGRTSEQNNTDWPGDERAIEVIALEGEPALPAEVAKARVRVRAQPYSTPSIDDSDPHARAHRHMHEARVKRAGVVIEEDRVCITANHAIFGALDEEPAEDREEHFVRLGDRWICCLLESWRGRSIRLGEQIAGLLAVVDALPRCECGVVATKLCRWGATAAKCDACARAWLDGQRFGRAPHDLVGIDSAQADHAPVDLPYAAALRALLAKGADR